MSPDPHVMTPRWGFSDLLIREPPDLRSPRRMRAGLLPPIGKRDPIPASVRRRRDLGPEQFAPDRRLGRHCRPAAAPTGRHTERSAGAR